MGFPMPIYYSGGLSDEFFSLAVVGIEKSTRSSAEIKYNIPYYYLCTDVHVCVPVMFTQHEHDYKHEPIPVHKQKRAHVHYRHEHEHAHEYDMNMNMYVT
jgi:hypothetical protein